MRTDGPDDAGVDTDHHGSSPRAVARWLGRSERSRWWTMFLVVAALCSTWSLATPVFDAPDEPAHAIRAASVARLEILGRDDPREDDVLVVDAPGLYRNIALRLHCYVFQREVPASCVSLSGTSDLEPVATSAARHPPAYYLFAGIPSLAVRSVEGIYLMRVVSALLTAAFLATAALTLERFARPRYAAVGLLLASTPMLFFVGGVVNPSAAEIPAAISLWLAAAVLVTDGRTQLDPRIIRRAGIAAVVLALTRQLSPLMLAVIAAAIVACGGWSIIGALRRSSTARRWGIAVAACVVAQITWIVVVRPLDASLGDDASVRGLTTGSALRISFGESLNRVREMVGWFGWLDAPSPGLTYLLWALGLAALATMALLFGRLRIVAVAGAVAVVTFLMPLFFETLEARTAGFFWQGRYTMPIAVGVPLLLGIAIAAARDADGGAAQPSARVDRFVGAIGVLTATASIVAFGQALRRNTVGYDGALDFLIDPKWSPPLPAWLLMIVAAALIVAFTWLVLAARDRAASPSLDAYLEPA